MGCVTDTIFKPPLRISPPEDGVIASKHSVLSTLVVVQWSRSGDPVRDVRCDRRHPTKILARSKYVISHCRACALTSPILHWGLLEPFTEG